MVLLEKNCTPVHTQHREHLNKINIDDDQDTSILCSALLPHILLSFLSLLLQHLSPAPTPTSLSPSLTYLHLSNISFSLICFHYTVLLIFSGPSPTSLVPFTNVCGCFSCTPSLSFCPSLYFITNLTLLNKAHFFPFIPILFHYFPQHCLLCYSFHYYLSQQ